MAHHKQAALPEHCLEAVSNSSERRCVWTHTRVAAVIIRVFKRGRERWHALTHQRQHLSGILAKYFERCQCGGRKLELRRPYYSSQGALRFNCNDGARHQIASDGFLGKLLPTWVNFLTGGINELRHHRRQFHRFWKTCDTLWTSQTFSFISACVSHWNVSVCCQCT